MKKHLRLIQTLLLILAAGFSLACPISSTHTLDFHELAFDYYIDAKGICFWWLIDDWTLIPGDIWLTGLPGFSGFPSAGTQIGYFHINNDLKGAPEFEFRVLSNGFLQAYIDFNGNGQFDPSVDVPIDYDSALSRLEISTLYGGLGLQAGLYSLVLNPDVFRLEQQSEALQTVAMTLKEGSDEFVFKRAFLRNAFIIPWLAIGGGISSEIIIVNPWPHLVHAILHFYGVDGSPLEVEWGGEPSSEKEVELEGFATRSLLLKGGESLQLGWVSITSKYILDGSLVYNVGGGEAGVASAMPANWMIFNAGEGFETAEPSRTAYAFANPTDMPTIASITCQDDEGTLFSATLEVPAMGAAGRFSNELCACAIDTPIRSVHVFSPGSLSAISLRTTPGGIVKSSLVGGLRRIGHWLPLGSLAASSP